MKKLLQILTYRRPAGSLSEQECINAYVKVHPHEMKQGNIVITIPKPDASASDTLFSCHTDTMHTAGGRQPLLHDTDFGRVFVDKPPVIVEEPMDIWVGGEVVIPPAAYFKGKFSRDYVLGADDGAGMWLLLELIAAKVPGTYVFHHSEECGGLGSRAMASAEKEWLKQFKRAIAFDRKGTSDIITSQRGGRCCSDGFAKALAEALNLHGHTFASATGSFTDTANYIDYIPECTNISCGYYNEHSNEEWLDVGYVVELRDTLLKIDWEGLPVLRDPTPVPYIWGGEYNYADNYPQGGGKRKKYKPQRYHSDPLETIEAAHQLTLEELEDECWSYPYNAAALLFSILHAGDEDESPIEKPEGLICPSSK